MDFESPAEFREIRTAVRELCDGFPGEYWRALEPDRYPEEFVAALTEQGWLAELIPEEYGGAGLGLTAASVILEEINASGCNGGACHAQMYTMGTILRHGSEEQKARYLPEIAAGELRLQAFGVTEPTAGSDTTSIQTTAEPVDGGYVIRGQKIWTSRALHSDLMLLLARTTPLEEVARKTDGPLDVHRRHEGGAGGRHDDDPADQDADEPRDDRGLLRRRRSARRRARRRGGQGVPLHPRRDERRADPDRRRVHRRRPLVRREGLARMRPSGSSSAGRSGRTRASSSRSPARTPRSRRPT